MTKVNPYLAFLKSVEKPKDALLIFDVDLAIQPSMSTSTTEEQKAHMWELYERTDGGVLFFTGRTHQSVNKTFGHDYAGVFEHYSMARFGHGQAVTSMAPTIDIAEVSRQARQIISSSPVRIAQTPEDIRQNSDLAVYVEEKNTSIALVHTLHRGLADAEDHLTALRSVLQPAAHRIVQNLNLAATHEVKTGGDAVEIVPKGMDPACDARLILPQIEINRLVQDGLSKATAIHNFQTLFAGRRVIMTGDSTPDLDAMVEAKVYGGKGVYVSNGIPLKEQYSRAVDFEIDHHTMTWPLIAATVQDLREARPTVVMMPREGGMTPSLNNLH